MENKQGTRMAAILLVLLFVGAFIVGLILHMQKGVRIEEFHYLQKDGSFVHGNSVFVTQETENGRKGSYSTGTQMEEIDLEIVNDRQVRFLFSDGRKQLFNCDFHGGLHGLELNSSLDFDWNGNAHEKRLCRALWQVHTGELESAGSWLFFVPYTLLYALGMSMSLLPEEAYLMWRCWQFARGKNTTDPWGVMAVRIGGIVLMLLGLALALSPLGLS